MREIRDLATGLRPDETIRALPITDRRTESDVLVNGVRRTWRDAFVNGLEPRVWQSIVKGGGSIAGARNSVTLGSGTLAGDSASIISYDTFTAPFRFSALMSLSARNASQNIYVELVSVGENGEIDEQNVIGWLFNGTVATNGIARVANNVNNQLDSSALTIITTATTAHFDFELLTDEARFFTQSVDSTSGRNSTFRRTQRLPDPSARYKIRVRTENTATTTACNVVLSHVTCEMFMEVPVEITGSMSGAGNWFGFQVWNTNPLSMVGSVARNSATPGNPINIAGTGLSAWPVAITTGRNADLVSDILGRLIEQPYSIPELTWQHAITVTATGDNAARAAQAAGVRNYVTSVQISNQDAAAREVQIKDGAATIIWRATVAAGRTMTAVFPVPLRGTAATALNVAIGAAAAGGVSINTQGYSAPV